ncbi:MAG: GNAT family N-acetyltransferase [Chitinophagaceae bacterium]|nr:MAG: GNAT family N-acetyltransferase [Chitinophagaceae bacterium]
MLQFSFEYDCLIEISIWLTKKQPCLQGCFFLLETGNLKFGLLGCYISRNDATIAAMQRSAGYKYCGYFGGRRILMVFPIIMKSMPTSCKLLNVTVSYNTKFYSLLTTHYSILNTQYPMKYTIRQFTSADLEAYKSMRLEALQLACGMFGNSYETEADFPEAQWLARIDNPLGGCFGLYYGEELIGITGIVVSDPDTPDAAYMTQSYIRAAYRGKGLSAILYDARLQWAREHGIKRLKIGHRKSNAASKAANQRYGFTYTHSEPRQWPDGRDEDMLYYELILP